MKFHKFKMLFVLGVVLMAAQVSQANAVAPQCNSLGAEITLASLLAGGANSGGCEVSDKIFSNFLYTGDIAAGNIDVTFQSNGPIPAGATIQFAPNNGANWAALTNLTFTTTIDLVLCPQCRFVSVLDQIFTNPTPNNNAGTFTHPGFGSVAVNGSSPANLSGQLSIGGTSVVTQFAQTGGSTLQKVSSSFSQTQVPEPNSMVVLGSALIGIALVTRKRLTRS
jgi:hypothetical protein